MSENRGNTAIVCLVAIGILICIIYLLFCRPDVLDKFADKPTKESFRQEAETLKQSNDDLTQQIIDMQAELEKSKSDLVSSEQAYAELDNACEALKAKNQELRNQLYGLELQNLHLSETIENMPKWKQKAEGMKFSLGAIGSSTAKSFKPEGTVLLGIGKGNWQVLTGAGYSSDGPKVSVGFQWTW